jgi:hypothetical protein
MINECPSCHNPLQFSPAQQDKIKEALAKVTTGPLKLGCPHCKKTIALQADGSLYEGGAAEAGRPAPARPAPIAPPSYPDISWLAQGIYADQELVADVPKALLLMAEGPARDAVIKAFRERGFVIETPESATDALVKMRFSTFAAVVLHEAFDGPLAESTFHQQMAVMPMERRRAIFYALIGPGFHTLYNLEALSSSANVVVNDTEVVHFDIILKKGLQEQQELFGLYAEAIQRMVANS